MGSGFDALVLVSLCFWSVSDQVSLSLVSSDATKSPEMSSLGTSVEYQQSIDHPEGRVSDKGREEITLLTSGTQEFNSSDFITSESMPLDMAFSAELDYRTPSQHTTDAAAMDTTDIIESRMLFGISCKWQNASGFEKLLKVCPRRSACDLGPATINKRTGPVQFYFCKEDEHLLMSVACRLEDSKRVVVLPRCMAGSECNIGPVGLSYRGRQMQGYFCDPQNLPTYTSWPETTESPMKHGKQQGRHSDPFYHRHVSKHSSAPDDDGKRREYDHQNISRDEFATGLDVTHGDITMAPDQNHKRVLETTP